MPAPRTTRQASAVTRVARGLRVGAAATARELALERDRRRAAIEAPERSIAPAPAPPPVLDRSAKSWPARAVESLVVFGIVALSLVAMGTFALLPSSVVVYVRLASAALFVLAGGILVVRARRVRPLLRDQRVPLRGGPPGSTRHAVRHWRSRTFERLADVVGRVLLLAAGLEVVLAVIRLV